jgi:hypothetical protein
MTDLEKYIIDKMHENLGTNQLEKVIIYLDYSVKRKGERISVGDVIIEIRWDGHLVFVDRDPKANWGHSCSYFVIKLNGPDITEIKAQMPPFLKFGKSNFSFLWRGSLAPEWAVVTNTE